MNYTIVHRIELSDEEDGPRFADVVEVDGVPHAVIEQKAESFVAIRLDPERLETVTAPFPLSLATARYFGKIPMEETVELPGQCSMPIVVRPPFSTTAQCLLATLDELEIAVTASTASREQAEALVASILRDGFETAGDDQINSAALAVCECLVRFEKSVRDASDHEIDEEETRRHREVACAIASVFGESKSEAD